MGRHGLDTPHMIGIAEMLNGGDSNVGRVVGVLQDGGPVTLDGCLSQNARLSWPGGLSSSTLFAHRALVGAEYEGLEKALFTEFGFSVEGLDTWLTISGFETELDIPHRKGQIHFNLPDDISIDLSGDFSLRFGFGLTFPSVSAVRTEAVVTQTVQAIVKVEEPQTIEYFSAIAFKLCNFLTLALDEAVCIQSMTGYIDREADGNLKNKVVAQIYGQCAPWTERKPKIRSHEALFLYPNIINQQDATLVNWFENYEKYEPAFDLYFASKTYSSLVLDTKILWLTQALEALHRRSTTETEMPVEEFNNLRQAVMRNCPIERHDWLKGKLRFNNELSLRKRMFRLLEPFERWFGNKKACRTFVNEVCATRNYLTHYDEVPTGNRASGSGEMFELFGKLEALLQLHLLKLAGLETSFYRFHSSRQSEASKETRHLDLVTHYTNVSTEACTVYDCLNCQWRGGAGQ